MKIKSQKEEKKSNPKKGKGQKPIPKKDFKSKKKRVKTKS